MPNVIDIAKELKSKALLHRDTPVPDFDEAHRLLKTAEQELRTALEAEIEDRQGAPEQFELDLAMQLTHIRGSRGGLFRRQGVRVGPSPERRAFLIQSIEAYDSGYEIEKVYRSKKDSYTLVQRLVARVLLEPKAADTVMMVVDLWVRHELEDALLVIRNQIEVDKERDTDEYAFADRFLVAFILGLSCWSDEMRSLLKFKNAQYAINGTKEVIEDLRIVAASSLQLSSLFVSRLDEVSTMFPSSTAKS